MPHSVRNRKKKECTRRVLNKRVKALQKLATKQHVNSIDIILDYVSLGDLRDRWKLKQSELHPAIRRMLPKFKRIPLNKNTPVHIYGSDGGLLACRVNINRPDLVKTLSHSIEAMPSLTRHYKFRGIKRSNYQTRHLGVWCPYATEPFYTAEHRENPEASDRFLKTNQDIFRYMSGLLGQLAPGVFKEFQRYPLPSGISRDCGAWTTCVINNGGNNPNQTEVHRDVKESIYGYSCVIVCGDFSGGDSVLWDLRMIIEMEPGDMLLFPDSLIQHSNLPAEGNRQSLVAFTQENMNDYWHRKYGMVLRRHIRREKKKKRQEVEKLKVRAEKRKERDWQSQRE